MIYTLSDNASIIYYTKEDMNDDEDFAVDRTLIQPIPITYVGYMHIFFKYKQAVKLCKRDKWQLEFVQIIYIGYLHLLVKTINR